MKGKYNMNIMIKVIIFTVCFALVLSATSCNRFLGIGDTHQPSKYVPEGYSGGMTDVANHDYHNKYGLYWLETYAEVLEAVELLKSHESTIKPTIGFDCDEEILEIKFCFRYERKNAEALQDGKNFFDRKIDGGEFIWFAFPENISIEELEYSAPLRYNEIYVDYGNCCDAVKNRTFEEEYCIEELSFEWYGKEFGYEAARTIGSYYVTYKGEYYFEIEFKKGMPTYYYDDFIKTLVIIN